MADRIRLLSEFVVSQIAAGQVADQPASVVKELMENALDAGARRVQVNYRNGGLELIQIADDGCGMSPIDARLAFEHHTTSKISTADDLYNLHTFGFRGEALASIAAVSQVELRTRPAEDELGTLTTIHGGKFIGQEPVMAPQGAQFFVRNLFYNVPARRRRHETRTSANAAQIKSEFQRIALCYPDIAFELYANDAPVYTLVAGTLAERIVDVVGRHIRQNLLEVAAQTSIATVRGYIGRPAAAKRRPANEQFLFVNGRFFKSSYFLNAILKGYEKLIPEGAQPAFFLYLTVDPSRIDVNVAEHKTEIHFADEQAVWQILHAAVRETLARTGAVPLMDFDRSSSIEIPVLQRGAVYAEPAAQSNDDYNPFRDDYIDPGAGDAEAFTGFDVPYADEPPVSRGAASAAPRRSGRTGGIAGGIAVNTEFDTLAPDGFEEFPSVAMDVGGPASQLEFASSEGAEQQLGLQTETRFGAALPLGGGYLATTCDGRLVVVDLRRARERLLYESYVQMLQTGAAVSEQLLFPEVLTLSADEYALLEEHAVEFAALGFDLEYCGGERIEVRGTPADLPAESLDRLLYELLQAFASPVPLEEVRRDRIATLMAQAGARGTLRTPTAEEAAELLRQLAATGNYSFSPSGKAILTEIAPEQWREQLG